MNEQNRTDEKLLKGFIPLTYEQGLEQELIKDYNDYLSLLIDSSLKYYKANTNNEG